MLFVSSCLTSYGHTSTRNKTDYEVVVLGINHLHKSIACKESCKKSKGERGREIEEREKEKEGKENLHQLVSYSILAECFSLCKFAKDFQSICRAAGRAWLAGFVGCPPVDWLRNYKYNINKGRVEENREGNKKYCEGENERKQ
jgi:hypothetical protein